MMLSIVTILRARCVIVAALALPVIFLQGCGSDKKDDEIPARGEECTPDNALKVLASWLLWDRNDFNCLCETEGKRFDKSGDLPSLSFDYSILDKVKLHDWPMIHSHDAGTGYHNKPICYADLAAVPHNWGVTQQGGLTQQLQCGARAFDIRIRRNSKDTKDLIFVHNMLTYPQETFKGGLKEVKDWANANPDELVILFIKPTDFSTALIGGETIKSGTDMVDQLTDAGFTYQSNCATIGGWTLGEAKAQALFKNAAGDKVGPGRALASHHRCGNNGPNGNYDTSLICHKFNVIPDGNEFKDASKSVGDALTTIAAGAGVIKQLVNTDSCYDDNQGDMRSDYWDYVKDVTGEDKKTRTSNGKGDRTPNQLWMVQAHYQYGPLAILAGAMDLGMKGAGCILNDVKATCINYGFAANIRNGDYQHGLNLIDVDYVCHHGANLFGAIKEYVASNYYKKFIPTPAPTPAPAR